MFGSGRVRFVVGQQNLVQVLTQILPVQRVRPNRWRALFGKLVNTVLQVVFVFVVFVFLIITFNRLRRHCYI